METSLILLSNDVEIPWLFTARRCMKEPPQFVRRPRTGRECHRLSTVIYLKFTCKIFKCYRLSRAFFACFCVRCAIVFFMFSCYNTYPKSCGNVFMTFEEKVSFTGWQHHWCNVKLKPAQFTVKVRLIAGSANLHIPCTNLHFGSRSFHIAAPTVWNSLPSTLHSSQTLNTFR